VLLPQYLWLSRWVRAGLLEVPTVMDLSHHRLALRELLPFLRRLLGFSAFISGWLTGYFERWEQLISSGLLFGRLSYLFRPTLAYDWRKHFLLPLICSDSIDVLDFPLESAGFPLSFWLLLLRLLLAREEPYYVACWLCFLRIFIFLTSKHCCLAMCSVFLLDFNVQLLWWVLLQCAIV